jgi:hypothetical protein
MKIRVYTSDFVPGYFTDIPGEVTFDPSHPLTYPGDEVRPVEILPFEVAAADRERWRKLLYTISRDGTVTIWERAGRTSADILGQ